MPRLLPTLFALTIVAQVIPAVPQHLRADEPVEKSAKLRLTLIDEATGKPLPRGWATLYPAGEQRTQHNEVRPQRSEQTRVLQFTLEPGDYAFQAGQGGSSPGGLQFDPLDVPERITLKADEQRELTINYRARPLTQQEIEEGWPMVAIGRVVDSQGEPLRGIEVRVATGWGTLLGGGGALTDHNGEYVLRFGPGIGIMNSKSQLQAAQFFIVNDEYVELSRSHEFQRMAYETSELAGDKHLDDIVVQGTPARLDFVLAKPATVEVRFIDGAKNPIAAIPVAMKSSPNGVDDDRHLRIVKPQTIGESTTQRWEAAPGVPWRFESPTARSSAITFPAPARYVVTLREHPAKDDDAAWLEVVAVQQTSDLPVESLVANDDPFARSPLSRIDRKHARQAIEKMAAANQRWLNGPAADLGEFSYRFKFHHLRDGEERSDDVIVKPGERQHGKHQGLSYFSAIHRLAADPQSATIRSFDVGPERTTIAYTFREPAGQAMGTGVAGSWAGYFSRRTVNGTLVVDSKRNVPLEWRDDECRETFSDFVEIAPDQFVPTRIEVAKGDMQFDWRFKWRPEGLWLFHESRDVDTDEIIASVENVRIDSNAGEGEAPAEPPEREAD